MEINKNSYIFPEFELPSYEKSLRNLNDYRLNLPESIEPELLQEIERMRMEILNEVAHQPKGQEQLRDFVKKEIISEKEYQNIMIAQKSLNQGYGIFSTLESGRKTINQALTKASYGLSYYMWSTEAGWKNQKHAITLNAMKEAVKKAHPEEYEQLLKDYQNSGYLERSFHKNVGHLIASLDTLSYAPRDQARNFMVAYRNVLESKEFEVGLQAKYKGEKYPKEIDVLLTISKARFLMGDNFLFMEQLVNQALKKDLTNVSEDKDSEQVEAIDFKQIGKLSNKETTSYSTFLWGKARGAYNFAFDPHNQGNTPYPILDFSVGQKSVKLLRFGSPTIETTPKSAYINPEFRALMHSHALEGKKHLYINLQHNEGWEKNRCDAIHNLHNEFPKSFTAVTLDQDSKWYKQKGYPDSMPTAKFVFEFCNQISGSTKSAYQFPDEWLKDPAFQKGMTDCMTESIEDLFGTPDNLTIQERQILIDDIHARMQLFMVAYSNCDTVNLSCKDAIDRGGKESTKFVDYLMIMTGQGMTKEHQNIHRTLFVGPAFYVKKRKMIGSRLERGEMHWKMMQNQEIRKKIENRAQQFKVATKPKVLMGPEVKLENLK